LSHAEYRTHYKKIKEYNIVRMSDICDMQRKRTTNFNKFCSEDATHPPGL
jgi:hypothetical protein